MNQIMIDWESRRVYCNVCGFWIPGGQINIDGTHDMETNERSAHTIWEQP